MRKILSALLICVFLSGCSEIPIKDGELAIGRDTTATLDGGTVAKIKNRF